MRYMLDKLQFTSKISQKLCTSLPFCLNTVNKIMNDIHPVSIQKLIIHVMITFFFLFVQSKFIII